MDFPGTRPVRLGVTGLVAVAGAIAHFDVSIHQGERPMIVQASQNQLAQRDGKLSRKQCFGMEKHEGKHKTDFIDTYGAPDDDIGSDDLYYPLRGAEHSEMCVLQFDLDNHLKGVSIDLWENGEI